jgi:hypothetical protein
MTSETDSTDQLHRTGVAPATTRAHAVSRKFKPPATPLKNGEKQTRWNRIPRYVADAIAAYVDGPAPG